MDRLYCDLGKLKLKNPVTTASGTYGFGREFSPFYDVGRLGGIMVKGITPAPRNGNKPQRLVEASGGVLNSIGLANPGIDSFIKDILPEIKDIGTEIIVNISGNTIDDYGMMAEKLSIDGVGAIEVNISCPNVKEGGIAFGTVPEMAYSVAKMVSESTDKPVILKLSPNVTDIKAMAKAVEEGGADIVSLINTLIGMAIDTKTRKPILTNIIGGFSGPPVKPVALRMVYEVYQSISIPIIGIGGIMNSQDAIEFILAGASAVSIGTGNMVDPYTPLEVIEGIEAYVVNNGFSHYSEMVGLAHK